ncbi:DUF2956 domain-containing protein [Vibrio salilacus]|uniref:DUF2956 domain-containing protein n=1 Tax=Vibrio salilacus TaxID=1323749 RepID=UPI000C2B02EA|nr:DUF2956 domain-containing protein [Vibrio salilacus]
MKNKVVSSPETQQEAMKIAKATQKPAQTKEQTKLIAQGIEKGIALYKKQQKERARLTDKAKKKAQKSKYVVQTATDINNEPSTVVERSTKTYLLPWILLITSWIGFVVYVSQS